MEVWGLLGVGVVAATLGAGRRHTKRPVGPARIPGVIRTVRLPVLPVAKVAPTPTEVLRQTRYATGLTRPLPRPPARRVVAAGTVTSVVILARTVPRTTRPSGVPTRVPRPTQTTVNVAFAGPSAGDTP